MLRVRDYLIISGSFVLLIVFFLIFQANFSINRTYVDESKPLQVDTSDYHNIAVNDMNPEVLVLCGKNEKNNWLKHVQEVLAGMKVSYCVRSQVNDFQKYKFNNIHTIILAMESWSELEDPEQILKLVEEKGLSLIVTNCSEVDEQEEIAEKIGIVQNEGRSQVDGMVVFDGIMFQGLTYYFDYPMEITDYYLDPFCKTWIVEYTKEQKEPGDKINLLWEKRLGKGDIFVFNNNLIPIGEGGGLLAGVISRMQDVMVYPIVNARVELIDYCPDVANGDEEVLKNLYNRNEFMINRDIFWPALSKILDSNGLVGSLYTHVSTEEMSTQNYQYIKNTILKKGHVVFENQQPGTKDDVTLPIAVKGNQYSEKAVFAMKSQIAYMGLASHYLDMRDVLGKNQYDDNYEWSGYSLELSKLLNAAYKDSEWLERVSATEAIERYKRYLIMEPSIYVSDESIEIRTSNFYGECYFITHSKRKLKQVLSQDYEIEELREEYYLITAKQPRVEIYFEEQN